MVSNGGPMGIAWFFHEREPGSANSSSNSSSNANANGKAVLATFSAQFPPPEMVEHLNNIYTVPNKKKNSSNGDASVTSPTAQVFFKNCKVIYPLF